MNNGPKGKAPKFPNDKYKDKINVKFLDQTAIFHSYFNGIF